MIIGKFMNNSKEVTLHGEKVIVSSLNESNMNQYLTAYKKASAFSAIYESEPDMWNTVCKDIEERTISKEDIKARYMIVDKESSQPCGCIGVEYSNPEMPEIDIAIAEEYRRKGFAFDAAKILIEYIFEDEIIKSIMWTAFPSNKASCRIAEKLGGAVVEGKNRIVEAMCAAGLKMDSMNDKEVAKTITYEIKRAKGR